MLKKDITYTDFNNNQVTETFYFNISRGELVELEVEYDEGFSSWIKKIVDSDDRKVLLYQFKRIILLAYGQKSEDGKRFIKTEELAKEFEQSAAYEALFFELISSADAAAKFIRAALPVEAQALVDQDKPQSPPSIASVPPAPPTANS